MEIKVSPYKKIEEDVEFWKKLFIKEKKSQNASFNTVKLYNNILEIFKEFAYLERVNNDISLSLDTVNKYFITAYITYLKDEKKYSDSTIQKHLKVIKTFFKFISENNEEAIDLLMRIEKMSYKVKKKEAVKYTDDEVKRIIDFIDKDSKFNDNFFKIRDYLMIKLLILTGIRAEELLNLRVDSIQEEGEYYIILIEGKGGKERINYVKKIKIKELFKKYLELKENLAIVSQYFFTTKKGEKIKYGNLYLYNKNLLEKLGIRNKALHAYRHYFAIKAVEEGINLQTLAEWLGHSSITITSEYYARSSIKAKKKMAEIVGKIL
ncbi:tyrosine-type recombinase/integrase [Caminibacter sp.]